LGGSSSVTLFVTADVFHIHVVQRHQYDNKNMGYRLGVLINESEGLPFCMVQY